MNEFTTKITVNGYSSQTPVFDLSDYAVASVYTRRLRITRIVLFSAMIPHSWSAVHSRFNNHQVVVAVKVGAVTTTYTVMINPTSEIVTTALEVANGLQLGLNASTPYTWTVAYNAAKKNLTVSITSIGATFAFIAYGRTTDNAIQNRGLSTIGFLSQAGFLPDVSFTTTKTGVLLDLQPIKLITIRVGRFNESTDNDRNGAKSHFVVPVNANWGEYVTFTPNSAFVNEAFIADHSADMANLRITLCDSDGALIPFNGGDTSLCIEFKTKAERHTRDHLY